MLFMNQVRKYMAEADDVPAGGGADDAGKTYTAAEVAAMVESETKGMKAKLDELLTEKKSASQKAKEAEAARIAAEQAAARQTGELDKFEASLRDGFEKEKEPLVAKLTALESKVLSAERKAILGGFAGSFLAAESVDLIAQLVKTEFDGESIKTQFVDFAGNLISTDPAEFKKWMENHPSISHLMKSDSASGGGAVGGKSTQQVGGAGNSKNEIINRRLTGLDARLKQS